MATGIVSLACRLLGMPWVAVGLMCLNLLLFVIPWTLTAARLVLFRREFFADLIDHK